MNSSIKKLIITTIIFIIILLAFQTVFASNSNDIIKEVEYSEEYKKWLALSDEEKEKVLMPRMYEIEPSYNKKSNPLLGSKLLASSNDSSYTLQGKIPMTIKNQKNTNSCWTFAALSSLETHLALKYNRTSEYDFSERHMEYAESQSFTNNQTNPTGYNKAIGQGGLWYMAESYLTNGTGAVPENEMPFENNNSTIDSSTLNNKTVSTQLYDTIDFADYKVDASTQAKIKKHIVDNGAVFANIYGNSKLDSNYYNSNTGAIYCGSTESETPQYDHAVSIIGWNDNYPIESFSENKRPSSPGAWIIKNSWGKYVNEFTLDEFKEYIFSKEPDYCAEHGWNLASQIPDAKAKQIAEDSGLIVDGNTIIEPSNKIGDPENPGIMYVSYEDYNIRHSLSGIEKATNIVNYENIYQYNTFYPRYSITSSGSHTMLCNVFDKKTTGTEYLTQVSINAPQTYTCKVYVNPNGSGKAKNDMQLIQLKDGESKTIEPGYHTLEFNNPVEIKGNQFAVVIEIEQSNAKIALEANLSSKGNDLFNNVTIENNKCFFAITNDFDTAEWIDFSKLDTLVSDALPSDSSIKAFTVSNIETDSIVGIEVSSAPTKTSYYEGDNFVKDGMKINALYNSGKSVELDSSSYSITNGTNLKYGQTSVTISYTESSKTYTTTQNIIVEKNNIEEIIIKNPPIKTSYIEGQDFETDGMVVEAKYSNGSSAPITNYTIQDGSNLQVDKTSVTISYEGKTKIQPITVTSKTATELKINQLPTKTEYLQNIENLDLSGGSVKILYNNNTEEDVSLPSDRIIISGFNNTTIGKKTITLEYQSKTTAFDVTIVENNVTSLNITTSPNKTNYIEGQNFETAGMVVQATLISGETKAVYDYTIQNGTNLSAAQTEVTISYRGKTVSQSITVNQKSVSELKINTLPTKTEYLQNAENLDLSGGSIKIIYNNNTEEDVNLPSDFINVSGFNNATIGKKTITLEYQSKTATFDVAIIENNITALHIITSPSKTNYVEGQSFETAGMVVQAIFTSGEAKTISDYTIQNGSNLYTGQTEVIISYAGKTATQAVTVVNKSVVEISINKLPTKTNYVQNIEELDLTGASINVKYDNNSNEEMSLPSDLVTVSGFSNENVGITTITLEYKTMKTTFDVTIIEEIKPESSNFDNATCSVNKINYHYDEKTLKESFTFNVTIDKIHRESSKNDKYEYYYYLSANKYETNISDWVKIDEPQSSDDKLEFKINSNDLKNYSELSSASNIYLYIKEVAINGGNQAVQISNAMQMDLSDSADVYINDTKVNTEKINTYTSTQNKTASSKTTSDKTTANTILPYTGVTTVLILISIFSAIGVFNYIKYKRINKYTK